jgi:hypothetical protein
MCHSVTQVMCVTLLICVPPDTHLIVMYHWTSNVPWEAFSSPISIKSGEWGGQKVIQRPSADYFVVGRRKNLPNALTAGVTVQHICFAFSDHVWHEFYSGQTHIPYQFIHAFAIWQP